MGTSEEAERCVAQFNNTTFRDRTLQVRGDTVLTKTEKKKIIEGSDRNGVEVLKFSCSTQLSNH